MSLDEVKMKTSSSQLVLWMEYLDWEINSFDKYCYYLAQLAAEVRRPNVKKGTIVKIEDFIMKFVHKKPQTEESKEATRIKVDKEKHFFFGLTGLLGGKNKKRNRRP